jgi:hypothetical protein
VKTLQIDRIEFERQLDIVRKRRHWVVTEFAKVDRNNSSGLARD